MTSERARLPWGLTIAAALVIAICAGLGVWQLQRLKWKEGVLAHIAALQRAPAQAISPVLDRAARGEDVSFVRVFAVCAPGSTANGYRMTSDQGDWVAHALALCRLSPPQGSALAPTRGVEVDRGILAASRGQTATPTISLPPPTWVEGYFRPSAGPGHPRAFTLVAEREDPPAPGVVPDPETARAPENLQFAGAYAPTWFGLAGVAAGVYAAMLWRRYRPRQA